MPEMSKERFDYLYDLLLKDGTDVWVIDDEFVSFINELNKYSIYYELKLLKENKTPLMEIRVIKIY